MTEILVIDDDTNVLDATKDALNAFGYEVHTSTSPDEAFQLLHQNPNRFDLILLDWQFPCAVHGDMFLKLINHCIPDFKKPIIFITGHTSFISKHAIRLGAYDTLAKPIIADVLIDAVERALQKRPPENPHQKVPADMSWQKQKKLELAMRITDAIISTNSLSDAAQKLECSRMTLNRWLRFTGLNSFVIIKEHQSKGKITQ
ncbi:MAG: hypothetical protein A3G33_08425 [Omnitrophica bacterium RIFCSPLOWO2_12_FULL_44_17]|uniref:Response regulatory domain-containing protein n=1 Tax=Candidatus Danuiimicrobium aquiferis TaxID=1801832 RepID=A0A1G1KWC8_9BACT|nr:MAG: hypothetical protein A3B72_03645 [Omnitrophica bacterium RIFCSPHIGHO2_02_FULL_45_28]OGW92047.1 MAG: hypothetical protein A3E74_01920 [Omnitrophica bacterium RIFCSPHIGHO2_12_FULL_44_12]OGW97190.1 MAG: hypothetical protein A3G33_08425 [Omnitrophica bacterium RIFCSPLOWO2_12_FULL_44_17]OGX02246.1 MAG: hypothetical protein A3J12_08215 [Omnitrophica bacterium RIFCSPLOWO2_02_FULL_44_11]